MTEDYDQLKAQKDRIERQQRSVEHQKQLDIIKGIDAKFTLMRDQLDRSRALLLESLHAVRDDEASGGEENDSDRLSLKIEALIKELT